MNNNQAIREKILTQAMQELKDKASSVLNDIMGGLYAEYLPHVESDTESNIQYRVEGCLKNILQGKIEVRGSGGQGFWVEDGYFNSHLISLSHNFDWKPLCDFIGETVQTQRIKQLEDEVENLNTRLKQSYIRY